MSHLPSLHLVSIVSPAPVELALDDLPPMAQLVSFLSIAEFGSISGAAAKLGRARSTVGRALRSLELHFGARLMVRSRPRMVLTEVGHEVLAVLKEFLAPMGIAMRGIRDARPALRVWAADKGLADVLTRVWSSYRRTDPRRIEWVSSTKEADIRLCAEPSGARVDGEDVFLCADEWVAVSGAGWTGRTDLKVHELTQQKLAFAQPEDALAWQWFLDAERAPFGLVMPDKERSRAVAAGEAVMLVNASHHAADLASGRLVAVSATRRWTGDGLWAHLRDKTARWDQGWSVIKYLRAQFGGGGGDDMGLRRAAPP